MLQVTRRKGLELKTRIRYRILNTHEKVVYFLVTKQRDDKLSCFKCELHMMNVVKRVTVEKVYQDK